MSTQTDEFGLNEDLTCKNEYYIYFVSAIKAIYIFSAKASQPKRPTTAPASKNWQSQQSHRPFKNHLGAIDNDRPVTAPIKSLTTPQTMCLDENLKRSQNVFLNE